ncbi:MAG TPA: Rieske 2Fe-2S domain-containing protein [Actinomycetota bacterium]|nr:Rieske 2Fe-2S domain-containing protein [Actinomycetota bacterium]
MRPRKRKSDAFVEAVLGDRPLPQGRIDDPEDVAVLQAAIELRAGREGADVPDEDFIAGLAGRLSRGGNGGRAGSRRAGTSRRAFLTGAAAAVAAGAGGIVLDRTVFGSGTSEPSQAQAELAPDQGQWVTVAAETDLGSAAKQFATGAVVGFVSDQGGVPVAVSGTCTHLGCLLRINAPAGRLDCPCHRTAFSYDGKVISFELQTKPPPLPRILARRQGGSIEVFVPPPA